MKPPYLELPSDWNNRHSILSTLLGRILASCLICPQVALQADSGPEVAAQETSLMAVDKSSVELLYVQGAQGFEGGTQLPLKSGAPIGQR
jgi:hypothetical protein